MGHPDINKILLSDPVSCARGAPMGATSYLDAPDEPLYVQLVDMVDGDYGADGTYWGGGGMPLYCGFTPGFANRIYVRSPSVKGAQTQIKTEFPEANFA